MPLVNTSIPNIIGGVTQQPDSTRFSGQCEIQENALVSVVDGLTKRPPLKFIKKINSAVLNTNTKCHFINRSDTEKYVITIEKSSATQNTMRIFNAITGDTCTIDGNNSITYDASNGTTELQKVQNYLYTADPQSDLKMLTIGDTTLVANKTQQVQTATTATDEYEKEAIVYVAQGDYEKTYEVRLGHPNICSLKKYGRKMQGSGGPAPPRLLEFYGILDGGQGYVDNTIYSKVINRNFDPSTPSSYNLEIRSNSSKSGHVSGVINEMRITSSYGSGYDSGWKSGVRDTSYGFDTDPNLLTAFNLGPGGGQMLGPVPAPPPNITVNYSYGTASFKSPASDATTGGEGADTEYILNALRGACNSVFGSSFDITQNGNSMSIKLKSSVSGDFQISTTDGGNNNFLKSIYKEVDTITDLPLLNKNGFVCKIKGEPTLGSDDMYVKFVTRDGANWGRGAYEETVGPDTITGLNNETLPIQIVSESLNVFTTSLTTYQDRICGDQTTNLLPSFEGSYISNLFLFKNRLGFLANENIVLSEAGNFFNFFRSTMTQLLDTDIIDVGVNSGAVTQLESSAQFQENLILFSNTGQFVLKGADLLTPRSVSVTNITNFDVDTTVDPINVGSYIYFATERDNNTAFREFQLNSTTDVYDSVEITEQIPRYIPRNITAVAGTATEDIIAVLSSDTANVLYIYKYYFNNNQKLLSSWSKFVFDSNAQILGIGFMDSELKVVVNVNQSPNTKCLLCSMNLQANPSDNEIYVDFQQTGTTDSNGQLDIELIISGYHSFKNSDGSRISNNTYTGGGKLFNPNLNPLDPGANVAVTAGNAYTMKYRFSDQLFKLPSEKGKTVSASLNAKLRNLNLFVDKTGFLEVKVSQEDRTTQTSTLGSDTSRNLLEDSHRFPIYSDPKNVTIDIENASGYPSNIQTVEFESFVHGRSQRV